MAGGQKRDGQTFEETDTLAQCRRTERTKHGPLVTGFCYENDEIFDINERKAREREAKKEKERDRETERQRDRETETETETETERDQGLKFSVLGTDFSPEDFIGVILT